MNRSAGYTHKEQIRMAARAYRSGLTQGKVDKISAYVTNSVLELRCFKSAVNILSYAAISKKKEIDTRQINRHILEQNKALVLPRIQADSNTLKLIHTYDLESLNINSLKIPEPIGDEEVSLINIDLVIVPMLAGDFHLNRVGYGMGYYDRLLTNFQGKSCGLLYDECLFEEVPVDEFDQTLDFIVTEKRIVQR